MGNKDGAYEADIQQTLSEVFRLLTPFVCAEPCHGYADHIVYINDETLTPWIHQTLQQRGDSIRAACTYYHHSENRCHQNNTSSPCAGKHCRRYQQLQQTRDRLKSSFPPGIHLVEVKSNHDNVNRFGYQLPHYCLFADYIWLAMEDHQPPDWLPPFIGILRYHHDIDTITIEGEAARIDRVPHLNERIIQEAHPPPPGQIDREQRCFHRLPSRLVHQLHLQRRTRQLHHRHAQPRRTHHAAEKPGHLRPAHRNHAHPIHRINHKTYKHH